MRNHEQRVFLLIRYMRTYKKFQDIIRNIIKIQKLQMLVIKEQKGWYIRYSTTAIEINGNRMIVTNNEKLRRYIYMKLLILKGTKKTIQNFGKNVEIIKANFDPQDY